MAGHVIKAEIDTAPPFESVKAAVSLFDEKAELKKHKVSNAEKRASLELEQLRENLAATKQQLSQAQSSKNELLLELRRLVDLKTADLARAFPNPKSDEELRRTTPHTVNKPTEVPVDQELEKDGHDALEADRKSQDQLRKSEDQAKHTLDPDRKSQNQDTDTLEADEKSKTRATGKFDAGRKPQDQATDAGGKALPDDADQELGKFHQSNSSVVAGPVSAATGQAPKSSVEEHSEATVSDERPTTRGSGVEHVGDTDAEPEQNVDFISRTVEGCLPAGSGGVTPIGSEAQSEGHAREGSWLSEDEIKGLAPLDVQMEIQATIEHLQVQLKSARESQERLGAEFVEAQANLSRVRAELEHARALELKARETEKTLAEEASELKARLSSLKHEKDLLSATAESLRDELSRVRMELAALNEAESENYQASVELERVKAELAAVRVAESKAKEAVAGLTQALHAVTKEAEEATQAAENALEEAHKASVEAEQARAHILTTESKLDAAIKEAQAARAAESMAVDELKLTEKAAASKTEEEAARQAHLTKLLQEAEEAASMKIAAALAQVESAKASEHEVKTKLEAALLDVETNKSLAKQALHRAEAAEAAKSAIENELRRRRKAAELATTSSPVMMVTSSPMMMTTSSPTMMTTSFRGSVQTPDRRLEPPLAHSMHRRSLDGYVSADVSTESIAELLQLKVAAPPPPSLPPRPPSSGTVASAAAAAGKSEKQLQKKKSAIMKLGSYLSRKKSSVSSTNS